MQRWYALPGRGRAVGRARMDPRSVTGFAWLNLGNAGSDMSDAAAPRADYTGVCGLSFVFALLAAASALAGAAAAAPRNSLWLLLLLGAVLLPPQCRQPRGAPRRRFCVQPNLADEQDWTDDF